MKMINLENIRLRKTPFTNKIEFVYINKNNLILDSRKLSENEISDCLVQLIDYMSENGADTIENPKTGEKWIFRKEYRKEMNANGLPTAPKPKPVLRN